MAMASKSNYGIIGVNNSVLTKMVVANLLEMDEYLIPCNKKGKPLNKNRNPLAWFNDYANSVEIREVSEKIYVKVYVISKFGESMSAFSDILFTEIEKDFAIVGLPKPAEIWICVKGVMSKQIAERDIDLVKVND